MHASCSSSSMCTTLQVVKPKFSLLKGRCDLPYILRLVRMRLLRTMFCHLPFFFVAALLHFSTFTSVEAFSTKYTNDMTISTPLQFEINGVRIENAILVWKPNIVFIAYRDQDHKRNGMYVVCDLSNHDADPLLKVIPKEDTRCSRPKVFYDGFVTSLKLLRSTKDDGGVIILYSNDRDYGFITTCNVKETNSINNVTCISDNDNTAQKPIHFATGASNIDAKILDSGNDILIVYSMRKLGMGMYVRICQYSKDLPGAILCKTDPKVLLKSNVVHPQDLQISILNEKSYVIVYSNWRNNMKVEMLVCDLRNLLCPSAAKVLNNKLESSHLSLVVLPSPTGKTEEAISKDGKLIPHVEHEKLHYINVIFRTGQGKIKVVSCTAKLGENNAPADINCLEDPIKDPFEDIHLVSHVVATRVNVRTSNMIVSFTRHESDPCDIGSMFCSIKMNHQSLNDELQCRNPPSHVTYQAVSKLKEPDTCTINSFSIFPVGAVNNVVADTNSGDFGSDNNDDNFPFAGMIMVISQGKYGMGLINWFGCPSGSVEMIDDGPYSDNELRCRLCDPGKYNNNVSTHIQCQKCAVGTYNALHGGSRKADCITCPVGKHGEKSGASSEEMCNSSLPFFTTIVIWVASFASLLLFICLLSLAYIKGKSKDQNIAHSFCSIICCCCTRLDDYEYYSDEDDEDEGIALI